MKFSLVIPNYNSQSFIRKFLDSLPKFSGEIIFIDNGSTDKSLTIIKEFRKKPKTLNNQLKIIRLDHNVGFAAAVNLGIKKSRYNFVVVLNNDVILHPHWFKYLKKTITNFPQAAVYCGTVLQSDGRKIESQGIHFQMSGKCFQINHDQIYQPRKQPSPYPVWGATAAAAVYRLSVIKKIGLFDETFFAYIEDVDLAYRLNKLGYQTIICPQASSVHQGGSTSQQFPLLQPYQTFINWFKLIFKNYSLWQIIYYFPNIFIERLHNFSYLLRSLFKLLISN